MSGSGRVLKFENQHRLNLRAELKSSRVDASRLDDATIQTIFSKVIRRREFVVGVSSIEEGRALEDGRVVPIIRQKSMHKKSR